MPVSRYGWLDLNPDIDILKDFGLAARIKTYIEQRIKRHSSSKVMHPFGRLSLDDSSSQSIESKVARADLANANSKRDTTFFPYHTFCLAPAANDAILGGQCRWYDNGLLEYDLVFRLSYKGHQLVDEEYNEYADVLSANILEMTQTDIDKHFNAYSDGSIFTPATSLAYQSSIGQTL